MKKVIELNTGILPIISVGMYENEYLYSFDIEDTGSLDECVKEAGKEVLENALENIFTNPVVTATGVYHPKQYNFETDELEFTLEYDSEEYAKLKSDALDNEEFEAFLADNYSSHSGFISFLANNLMEFEEQDDWKQFVQVVMFSLRNINLDNYQEDYDTKFMELVDMNFDVLEEDVALVKEDKIASSKFEVTCPNCLEHKELDWSNAFDFAFGTSGVDVYEKDNGDYGYFTECDNCGKLIEIEDRPELDLQVFQTDDMTKDGFYMEVEDKVTGRKCWYEVWLKDGEWNFDFNQYIFSLDNVKDLQDKMFQEELLNYSDEIYEFIHEVVRTNKLEEAVEEDNIYSKISAFGQKELSRLSVSKVDLSYIKGYEAGVDKAVLVAQEDYPNFQDDIIDDLESKKSEIYSDIDSLTDEEVVEYGINDSWEAGYVKAFDNIIAFLNKDKKDERVFGPSEEVIDDSKEKGLYTESIDEVSKIIHRLNVAKDNIDKAGYATKEDNLAIADAKMALNNLDGKEYEMVLDVLNQFDSFKLDEGKDTDEEDDLFSFNCDMWRIQLDDVKHYIEDEWADGTEEEAKNLITLEELGRTVSKELANVGFQLGFATHTFERPADLESAKQEMIERVRHNIDDSELEDGLTVDDIVNEINGITK